MTTILGLSGSLRAGSLNTALLRTAVGLMPEGARLDAHTLHGVPLFNEDDETAHGAPAPVAALKEALKAADGLLLVTPEYNNGIPGVFKNAIDWMTRKPGGTDLFQGKPVALIGASPGGFGTILAQDMWLSVLRTLGTRPYFEGRLMVSRATAVFDSEGRMSDAKTESRLRDFLAGFTEFARR